MSFLKIMCTVFLDNADSVFFFLDFILNSVVFDALSDVVGYQSVWPKSRLNCMSMLVSDPP